MPNLLHIFFQLRFFAWLLWKNPFLSSLSTFGMRKWRCVFFISIFSKLLVSSVIVSYVSYFDTKQSILVPTSCSPFIFYYACLHCIKEWNFIIVKQWYLIKSYWNFSFYAFMFTYFWDRLRRSSLNYNAFWLHW
jgi:hypothetical protein